MHFQYLGPPPHIRTIDGDLAVKATGTQQRRVQNIGAVRRRDEDHAFRRVETIHFDEELIEGLFALIVSASETRTA